jgi:hypothetical protein
MGRPEFQLLAAFLAAALPSTAHSAAAQNLVVNGSFETGDFTGWKIGAREDYELPYVEMSAAAPDGLHVASIWTIDYGGYFSQTIEVVPGRRYRLDFSYNQGSSSRELCGEFYDQYLCDILSVSISGAEPRQWFYKEGGTGSGWTHKTFAFKAASQSIQLSVRADTPIGRLVQFDNFQIGVPEPASWALMIAGFGLVGAALRGRRSVLAALQQ